MARKRLSIDLDTSRYLLKAIFGEKMRLTVNLTVKMLLEGQTPTFIKAGSYWRPSIMGMRMRPVPI